VKFEERNYCGNVGAPAPIGSNATGFQNTSFLHVLFIVIAWLKTATARHT